MMRVLLDTNVVSELNKRRPDPAFLEWIASVPLDGLYLCEVTIGEIRHGIHLQQDLQKAKAALAWLDQIVRPRFAKRILAVDENVLFRWRVISRDLQKRKQPTPPTDLLIAAIALENNMSIATRDVGPFVAAAVAVVNPWTGERFNQSGSNSN